MQQKPLYFDNAATSFPKPEVVYQACDRALRNLGNPGRGGHRLALEGARTLFEGREAAAAFFSVPSERLVFTSGCTAAVNIVLNGLVGSSRLVRGDSVLVTSYEHNAVMRPLHWLERQLGIKVFKIERSRAAAGGLIDTGHFETLIKRHKPKLCLLNMASNVSGEILDLERAHDLCHQQGVSILLDGAQTAGSIDINLSRLPAVAYFATSAHKGLLGPTGLGLLYVREGENLDPLLCGGTGSRSESLEMPAFLPDRLEPGTAAAPLVSGLTAALSYLSKHAAAIRKREAELSATFITRLKEMPGIKLHGRGLDNIEGYLPTFALSFQRLGADQVADVLDREHDIAVRPGLHCAVSAHETLGTVEGGLVRVSFGAFNTPEEIDQLCTALQSLQKD